jgi:hypothetical protein
MGVALNETMKIPMPGIVKRDLSGACGFASRIVLPRVRRSQPMLRPWQQTVVLSSCAGRRLRFQGSDLLHKLNFALGTATPARKRVQFPPWSHR